MGQLIITVEGVPHEQKCAICREPIHAGRLVCSNKKCIKKYQLRLQWGNNRARSKKREEERFTIMEQKRQQWAENLNH